MHDSPLFSYPSLAAMFWIWISAVPLVSAGQDMKIDFPLFPRAFNPLSNLMTFSSSIGASPSPITSSGNSDRPFKVDGNTFSDFSSAWQRSCNVQKNDCANKANKARNKEFKVSDCDSQENSCIAAASSATQTSFLTLTSTDDNFDYFCES